MTACGNKESETVTPDNSTTPEAVETQPTQEAPGTEETTSRDDTGVYPNATGLTEVAMGVTEDICTFKVPLNYVLAGGYYDENNEEHTIQGLNSATTTVEEALAAGSFSTGNHLAFFTMTSLDADQTMITTETIPGRDGDEYTTIYRQCGLCELGRKLGHSELVPYMCQMDYISVDMMSGVLHRTKTLATGGDCCDFYVCKKGSKWDTTEKNR